MKSLFKNLFIAFIGMMIFASPAVSALSKITGLPPVIACVVTIAVAVVLYIAFPARATRKGVYANGIQVEIWVNYIIERLFKDNKFLQFAWNDDDKVVGGKIVHIPNPGARPTVVKNRSVFPATAVRRTDTDIVYPLDEFTTDPTHIENAEMVELSYDKIASVLGDHIGYLTQDVADQLILRWLDESVTSPTKLYTSGGATGATAPSGTGNRKLHITADVKAMNLTFNLANLPRTDRYYMPTANMLDQLLSDLSQTQYRDFSAVADPATGVIGKLYGFTILDRSSVAIADSGNAIKAFGAAGAVGDNEVGIAWQKDAVSRAMGEVKFFEHLDNPLYYGNVYSSLLRMGGRRRRGDDKGVIAMIQAASA